MHEERIDSGGVPARLYDPGGATGVLLLGHGGGQSKDGERFVRLARAYAEGTGLAVVCMDAVDHGERAPKAGTSTGLPPRWHSTAIGPMVADWQRMADALASIGPAPRRSVRMGAGLRLGVNVGYMKFSEKQNWLPF